MHTIDPFADANRSRVDHRSLYKGSAGPTVPTAAELGSRFRDLRKQKGVSLAAVARAVGHDPKTISRFEKHGKVSAELLLKLVNAMSSATDFVHLFRTPKFGSIQEVVRHAKRTRR